MATNPETISSRLGLTESESHSLLKRAVTCTLPKDPNVLKKENRSDALHLVLEGQVKAFEIDSEGNEMVLSYHGAGDYFGRMSLDKRLLTTSIMTAEPSRILVL